MCTYPLMENCTLPTSQTAFRAQPRLRVGVQHVVPDIVLHHSPFATAPYNHAPKLLLKTLLMYGAMRMEEPSFSLTYATERGLRVPNPNSRGHTTKRGLQVPNPNSRGHATKRGLRVPNPNSRGHATKLGLRVPNPNSRGHTTKRGLRVPHPNSRGHTTKHGFRD